MQRRLRVGVVGIGHLGSRHAQIYAKLPSAKLVVVCDRDVKRARQISQLLHCQYVTDYREMAGLVDAASLSVPTSLHAEIGKTLLCAGMHLLIEKPIATSLAEANALIRAAGRKHCVLQIGHVERFNAAIHAALKHLKRPRFIEVHRLSPYPFRGTDVSVVLDVMIHDLDLICMLVRSGITRIDAQGISVLSPSEDIANARLQFASGCVANLTASRISEESVRRFRVFQEDRYLSIDHQAQSVELAKIARGRIRRVRLPVNKRPPLQEELFSFVQAVRKRRRVSVSGREGRKALSLALRIEQAIRSARDRWHR